MSGWIGVDLDGTLAHYDGWKGEAHVGEPIPAMVERVKGWLAAGREVRIFTARAGCPSDMLEAVEAPIKAWCVEHLGQELPITNVKDFGMVELWDDRCVQVVPNTGEIMMDFTARVTIRRNRAELRAAIAQALEEAEKQTAGPIGAFQGVLETLREFLPEGSA